MSADYIPRSDGDMLKWDSNFSVNLPNYAKDLGVSQEDVAKMQDNCKNIDNGINDCTKAQAFAKEAAAKKLAVLKMNTDELRTGIQQFKKTKGYTEAIGKALGVIGTDDPIEPEHVQAEDFGRLFPSNITVKFTKKGVQDVNIYSKLKGEEKWEKLAFDSYSPYEAGIFG